MYNNVLVIFPSRLRLRDTTSFSRWIAPVFMCSTPFRCSE